MTHHRDFVTPAAARPVEEIRRRWDGVMAAQIAAHVTLAHPRTSTDGRACWNAARALTIQAEFTVTDVALTAFDGTRWDVLETCPLLHRGGREGRP